MHANNYFIKTLALCFSCGCDKGNIADLSNNTTECSIPAPARIILGKQIHWTTTLGDQCDDGKSDYDIKNLNEQIRIQLTHAPLPNCDHPSTPANLALFRSGSIPLPTPNPPGYYWKDYIGTIPDDAVPGGTVKRNVTYIGQVFLKALRQLIPATIYPDQVDVYFPYWGSHISEGFVQILCSRKTKLFRWIPANNKEFHVQTIGYNLVAGGREDGKLVHIGRYHGDVFFVGKVRSATVGDAKLFFVKNGTEYMTDCYEVLVFEG